MDAIARVVVDSALPHLDREFDYSIPESLHSKVQVGTRVRVPFAGRLVSAVVVALPPHAAEGVTPRPLRSAAGFPSFTADAISLARAVAHRYGGSLWDVLRLMAPPRVASLESRVWQGVQAPESASRLDGVRVELEAETPSYFDHRTVWHAPPAGNRGVIPARQLLAAAIQAMTGEHQARGSAVIVVPDARALSALEREATSLHLKRWTAKAGGDFAVLDHDDGPSSRYGAYLAAMTGEVRLVFGTRVASLQPVPRLAFMAVWDEGSDALLDAHAPYFHARTVAAMRASETGCRLLLAAFAPSVDAAALVAHGFATAAEPARASVREATPTVTILDEELRAREGGSGRHWMPSQAWRGLVTAAEDDAVALLVPRAGYISALACAACGAWVACPACEGELYIGRALAAPACRDCGAKHEHLHCSNCGSPKFSAARQGVESIAEQVGRMTPRTPVHVSSASSGVLADFTIAQGIVVATPAALPAVVGGYSRLVIVGADATGPGGLGAELFALRWWINATALVRSRSQGGAVLVIGDPVPLVRTGLQAWDAWGAAQSAYEERAQLDLPPARRAIRIDGGERALEAARAAIGPFLGKPGTASATMTVGAESATILVSRAAAQGVVDTLRTLIVDRSREGASALRMRVDAPLD